MDENESVKSEILWLFSINLLTLIPKYPHNIEFYVCILWIFALTILSPISVSILLAMYSTSKLSKNIATSFLT